MKAASHKAIELVDDVNIEFGLDFDQVCPLIKAITKLLKHQDRDTRHACAEAVMGLEACSTSNDNAIYLGPDYIVNKAVCADDAFAACINVKAV